MAYRSSLTNNFVVERLLHDKSLSEVLKVKITSDLDNNGRTYTLAPSSSQSTTDYCLPLSIPTTFQLSSSLSIVLPLFLPQPPYNFPVIIVIFYSVISL